MKTDQPIHDKSEDRLDRGRFVESIAERLVKNGRSSGVSLGLIGPWGAGKSSILNLLDKHLTTLGALVVRFDPWLVSGRDDLIGSFFGELVSALRVKLGDYPVYSDRLDQTRDKAIKIIEKYGETISPVFRLIFPGMDALAKLGSLLARESATKRSSIHAHRERVRKALSEIKIPIVVLIDEMDRIEDSEVKTIAQLIRAVADFSSISYVVAYDESRVIEALGGGASESQLLRGRSYLEKILQVRVSIPFTSPSAVAALLRDELFNGIQYIVHMDDFQLARLDSMLNIIVPDAISTSRDVRRLVSDVEGRMLSSLGEVDPVDCIGYSVLQMKSPTLFRKVGESLIKPSSNITFEKYFHAYMSSRYSVSALPYDIWNRPTGEAEWDDNLFSMLWPATIQRKGEYFGLHPRRVMFRKPLLTLANQAPLTEELTASFVADCLLEESRGAFDFLNSEPVSMLVDFVQLAEESATKIERQAVERLIEYFSTALEARLATDQELDTMSILLISAAIGRIIDRMEEPARPDLAYLIANHLIDDGRMTLACGLLADKEGFDLTNSSRFGWSPSPLTDKKIEELKDFLWKRLGTTSKAKDGSWPIILPHLILRGPKYADEPKFCSLKSVRAVWDAVDVFFSGRKTFTELNLRGVLDVTAMKAGLQKHRSKAKTSIGLYLPGFRSAFQYFHVRNSGNV